MPLYQEKVCIIQVRVLIPAAWNCVLEFQAQDKFKNPLVDSKHFYLKYKLSSEQYPINIELSQNAQALAAFKKFAALKQVSGATPAKRVACLFVVFLPRALPE